MRLTPIRATAHLVPAQRQKFLVARGTPGKRVDAIKTQNMIDPENVEGVLHSADPLAPPAKIVLSHCSPLIKRNAPVLSPFLSELVVFEVPFRRRAASPFEREFVRLRK